MSVIGLIVDGTPDGASSKSVEDRQAIVGIGHFFDPAGAGSLQDGFLEGNGAQGRI
ncbi:hypothetical protein [Ferrovibrio xuzhouensis]|uniref:Uncharacterized protein n=1 Tax=Ferrovibrio xuzhouensis TaxID=1576914 RepID=A0ABV7VAZ7_9PROT